MAMHGAALGAPGGVAAAGRAPDELAGADLEPGVRPLLVDEGAVEHVGLLDQHVLVVGQRWRPAAS